MLPKEKRLNLSKEFKSVASSGKRIQTKSFRIMYKFWGEEEPKVGIALSKALSKKATERNQAKRLVANAIEPLYPNLKRGLNLVIMPKASVLTEEESSLQSEIQSVKDIFR